MDNPLRIAICEDNEQDTTILKQHIENAGLPALCDAFDSAEKLMSSFYAGKYDLILMDIYMGGPKGLYAAQDIREIDRDVMIAFTTSSPDHALEGYRLDVLKYLEKPITLEKVADTLRLADTQRRTQESISLRVGGELVDILLNDILYFEINSSIHAVLVHFYEGTLRLSQTIRLEDIEKMVPPEQFLRCHRGYIVNLRWVWGFDGPDFIMENGEKVYVRMRDKAKAKEAYDKYMLSLLRP